jgi:hypothetical protein
MPSSIVSDFDSIVQRYGEKLAKEHKTKCQWTDITGKKDTTGKNHHVDIVVGDPIYQEENATEIKKPDSVYDSWYDNNTSVDQSQHFAKSIKTANEFSWTMTEAIKVSNTTNAFASIPGFAAVRTSFTEEISVSSTQTQKKTKEDTWSIVRDLTVPANSSIHALYIISMHTCDVSYYVDVTLSGKVTLWFKDKIDLRDPDGDNKHWEWFLNVTSVILNLRESPEQSDRDLVKNYEVLDNKVRFRAKGKFSCNNAINDSARADEYHPVRPGPTLLSSAPLKTLVLK